MSQAPPRPLSNPQLSSLQSERKTRRFRWVDITFFSMMITVSLATLITFGIMLFKQQQWQQQAALQYAQYYAQLPTKPISTIELNFTVPYQNTLITLAPAHLEVWEDYSSTLLNKTNPALKNPFILAAWQTAQQEIDKPFYQFDNMANQLNYAVPLIEQGELVGLRILQFNLNNTLLSIVLNEKLLIFITLLLIMWIGLGFLFSQHYRYYRRTQTSLSQLYISNCLLEKEQKYLLAHQAEMDLNKVKTDALYEDLKNYAQDLEYMQKAALNIMQDMDEARREANAANRTKSEFLANMSHEIRTPMNGVLGMLSLVLDSKLTAQQREYLEVASYSGDILLNLINDILDYSKIEAGRLELESIDFDLRRSVDDVVELLSEKAESKSLTVGTLYSANLPQIINGDPTRFRQVITNLLGNAIKFTDAGEVLIRVKLLDKAQAAEPEQLTQQDDFVSVYCEVCDTGIGIPLKAQKKIFESFSQADGSTTRKYGGTGLGLALCKQLVNCMGGEINVRSELGKGSVFGFSVQFRPPQQTDEEKQWTRHPDLRGLHALIVDDNATNRKILEHNFDVWEIRHTSCENGQQALTVLREAVDHDDPFNFAVLDMMMEGMDGLSLSYAIKTNPKIAPTRLIMLSSHAQRGDAENAKKVGFSAYLTKPVRQSKLYEAITLVMGLQEHQQDVLITQHTISELHYKKDKHILLVEDNIFNQKVALGMLQKLGLKVDIAHNGQEAVNALQQQSYDLVFMDCQMPVMDGFEATALIREQENRDIPGVPIIAMTANAMDGDKDKCLTAQMSDYMSKPFKINSLQEMLAKWL